MYNDDLFTIHFLLIICTAWCVSPPAGRRGSLLTMQIEAQIADWQKL